MPDRNRLNLVLCWHMHQPQYQTVGDGRYWQPWVYLHAIKDYVDMAAHIESIPLARAVVNFSPVLLDQLADYVDQMHGFLTAGRPLRDPLLGALVGQYPDSGPARVELMRACLRAHKTRMIERFPIYQNLADMAESVDRDPNYGDYLNDQYLMDLTVWYHLAWLGETIRRTDSRVERFMDQGRGFDESSGRDLLAIISELVAGIIPRYRELALQGRIELSFTPYSHPIIPLLLDFSAAREAQPDAPLPAAGGYPGGPDRARRQIQEGEDVFARHFGFRPKGCWPSEGALSAETLGLFEAADIRWTASGERVLRHTMEAQRGEWTEAGRHRAYQVPGQRLKCFFRDDGLSDLIGFSYADWHADDAIGNLIEHLDNIALATDNSPETVVSIIMDGENAWEYYPENGYYFLRALYDRLARHPGIRLTTFSEYLEEGHETLALPRLVAGSWVNGTLATWIGQGDKNRAWDILVEAKLVFDRVVASGRLSEEQRLLAERALAICEGSDWCWWFGDYNPADAVARFERLYRTHVMNLYAVLGETAPLSVREPFVRAGVGEPARGGVMRSSGAL